MNNILIRELPVIEIPVGDIDIDREVGKSNSHLTDVLLRRKNAEMKYYNIPRPGADIFRRRIVATRVVKGKLHEDVPDLLDVHHTDLPWLGRLTFKQAHRQFRSKYALEGVVELIREIDGYLWNLTVELDVRPPAPTQLNLLSYSEPKATDIAYRIQVQQSVDAFEITHHFGNVPEVPESFLKEMTSMGYEYADGLFRHPSVTAIGGVIRCSLWGKLVTVPAVQLSLAS